MKNVEIDLHTATAAPPHLCIGNGLPLPLLGQGSLQGFLVGDAVLGLGGIRGLRAWKVASIYLRKFSELGIFGILKNLVGRHSSSKSRHRAIPPKIVCTNIVCLQRRI